jgi:hypothetical protein
MDGKNAIAVNRRILGRRRLAAVAGIITPDTILRRYRTRVAQERLAGPYGFLSCADSWSAIPTARTADA